jgi:hypothetical protein
LVNERPAISRNKFKIESMIVLQEEQSRSGTSPQKSETQIEQTLARKDSGTEKIVEVQRKESVEVEYKKKGGNLTKKGPGPSFESPQKK